MARGGGLLERRSELERLERLVDRAAKGDGGCVLVEGVAGIGKTRLLDALRTRATASGFQVAWARSDELERELPWGVARQLFEPLVSDDESRAGLLAGAAANVGPLLGLGGPAAPPASDPALATLHGLYWLAANASTSAPLLIAVDDAQWADDVSSRFLAYAARRVEDLPILVAIAARPGADHPAAAVLDTIALTEQAERLAPRELSADAVATLIGEGSGTPDEVFAAACREATGGNPFLVRELVDALAREGIEPTAANAARIDTVRPETVRRWVIARLAALGDDALRLARAVAVVGASSRIDAVAAIAGLDAAEAAAVAGRMGEAGVFAAGLPLTFAHPLLRAGVYEDWAEPERALAHRRAAAVLADDQAPVDRIAGQLVFAPPAADAWVVDQVRAAAAESFASGDAAGALRLLRRALGEPPTPELLGQVLLELGRAEAVVRDPEAIDRLRAALAHTTEPPARAAVSLALGEALVYAYDMEAATTVLDAALAERDVPPEARVRMEIARYVAARTVLDNGAAPDARLEALAVGGAAEAPPVLAIRASAALLRGAPVGESRALLDRALASGARAEEVADSPIGQIIATGLMWSDQLERALDFFEALLAEARRRGSVLGYLAITYRSDAAYRAGRLLEAEADAREALALVSEYGYSWDVQGTTAFLAQVLLERGECVEALGLLEAPGMEAPSPSLTIVLHVKARLLMALGRVPEAIAALRECGELLARWEMNNPTLTPWRSTLAIALRETGDLEEAAALAGEQVRLARAVGAPRAVGISLRTAGVVKGGGEGVELIREALSELEPGEARLETARTLVELGSALRAARNDTDARTPLERGVDLAHRCGATALRDHGVAELVATGARPRRYVMTGRDALTAAEGRVAGLAADGMANRDIAQALFVTQKTVEKHLTSAYGKLGIASRAELAEALGRAPGYE